VLNNLFERRSAGGAFQRLFAAGALTDRPSPTGIQVTEDTALRLSAVSSSIMLIADTISTLPLDQFFREDGQRRPFRPRERWVEQPSLTLPRTTFWQQVVVSLLLDGNAFVRITRDGRGVIEDLTVLNPTNVDVLDDGFRLNGQTFLRNMDVLHVTEMLLPGEKRGTSRIKQAKDSLGLGLALEEYAGRFFGNGAYAGVVLEVPNELTKEQAEEIQQAWEAKHRGLGPVAPSCRPDERHEGDAAHRQPCRFADARSAPVRCGGGVPHLPCPTVHAWCHDGRVDVVQLGRTADAVLRPVHHPS
jgi:phage portal protein BeeE